MRFRRGLVPVTLVGVLAAGAAIVGDAGVQAERPATGGRTVDIQLLAINDFHGNLQPPSGSSGRVTVPNADGTTTTVDAGGAAYLATHIAGLEATNPNTLVVSAGDLIGASPLLSSLFHDEPTIEAMNDIGLDLNAVGNHEFDEGTTELLRMQDGGCHPIDGCLDGDGFAGADFQFLAANVVNDTTGDTLFPPYSIQNVDGAKVAFIGMTLEGTPTIVSASGILGWSFLDEADTANALIQDLERRQVESIVVLIHEGGFPAAPVPPNGCAGISGPIVDIVERLDPAVDLVVSGHTHQPYNCVIDDIPTTSAFSFGRLVTDIDMTVDKGTKDVTAITINNVIVTRDVAPDPEITQLIADYGVVAAPIANRPIGNITADITRANDDSLENALGDAIADAQLAASDGDDGGAVMAFMNPGGVRADLTFASSPVGEGDGVVTYGEAFTVQPFGNNLVTMTLTGAQVYDMLEQQFCATNDTAFRVLLPSAGVNYTWNPALAAVADPGCTQTVVTDLTLNGAPVTDTATYRVTVNSFLADGGDGFTVLRGGADRVGGVVDTDAFEAYISSFDALAPPARDRIDVVV